MNTILYILYIIVMAVITLVVTSIFIHTGRDLWKETKPELQDWFKTTRLGMWYNNKKNGVTILSDKEYCNLLKSGSIRFVEVETD